jgi:RNA polymerase sigma-70 factor (ECF subfamily)
LTADRAAASDETLLEQAQGGDEWAFHRLFERYAPAVAGRIRRVLPAAVARKVSGADVLQEVRITAFRKLAEFEHQGPASFRRWLMRIAEFKLDAAVRKYARTAKRAAHAEVTRGQRPETAAARARDGSPSEAAMAAERAGRVRDALAALPGDYRRILELVFNEQLTLREAGARMDRSREAAKKLYGRALARFTELIDGNGEKERG